MTYRDIESDWRHAQPWTALNHTLELLRNTDRIWHLLEMPEMRDGTRWFVATGHINCHDCLLCEEQGNVCWIEASVEDLPVPWRESYADCCDDQD